MSAHYDAAAGGSHRMGTTDATGLRSYELALAEGDRVRLFKRTNAKFQEAGTVGNIGRNGTVLEITAIRDDGLMARNPAGKMGFVAWVHLKDAQTNRFQLAYGDALTTNTAQGTTVTEHIHAIPAGSRLVSAFGAYTSGSRHREQSFIVTPEGAERAEIAGRRPLGDRREILQGDILANITRNFAQAPEKESALDMIDRAAALRRGTIQAVQRSLQSMEVRAATGQKVTTLSERFVNRRVNQTFEERLPEFVERLQRHSAVLARVIRTAGTLADRLADILRRMPLKGLAAPRYRWTAYRTGKKIASGHEHVDTQRQPNRRRISR